MTQPMFSITGQLLKAYPETKVDQETGEESVKYRIQLLGDIPLRDGSGTRYDMVTLTGESMRPYAEHVGKRISVPFGFFAPSKGQVVTFVPKGSTPQILAA